MPRSLLSILVATLCFAMSATAGDTAAGRTNSAPPVRSVAKPAAEKSGVEKNVPKEKEAGTEKTAAPARPEGAALEAEIQQLKELLLEQKQELEAQRALLNEQQKKMQALEREIAERTPAAAAPAAIQLPGAEPAVASQAGIQEYTAKVDELEKKVDRGFKNLGGFKFSGDFRFRADVQARSSNDVAGPLQNIRSRYRLRLNVDKELDSHFNFHLQLSTGPLNNGLTNDQDFASTVAKHPFSIAEAYVDFHPTPKLALRAGRMEEVFADNMRFLWDDDVRFNGFHQIIKVPVGSNFLGLKSIEFRSGEYILTNPNVVVLASFSPLVSAGFPPGQRVGDAALFHPGLILNGSLGTQWNQRITADFQVYRNPNQIQLASLASGFPILVSNGLGIALSGPMTGTGNATTTSGGAIYSAQDFQIAHLAYRLEYKGLKLGDREMPLWFDLQMSRNTGTNKLRDAVMASANIGSVKKLGDVRFLYQFAIKDANALISQFTDDDLGTGSGVNIAVHAVRFDLGLTRFLQWQNLLFIQHERRSSNAADQFFVPLQQKANATFRYLGQLTFTF